MVLATALAVTLNDEDIFKSIVICRNSLQAQTFPLNLRLGSRRRRFQYLAHQQAKGWSYIRA